MAGDGPPCGKTQAESRGAHGPGQTLAQLTLGQARALGIGTWAGSRPTIWAGYSVFGPD